MFTQRRTAPFSNRSFWFSRLVLFGPPPETSQNELAESSDILTSTVRRFVSEAGSVDIAAAVGQTRELDVLGLFAFGNFGQSKPTFSWFVSGRTHKASYVHQRCH
jgi:hypothetical protein